MKKMMGLKRFSLSDDDENFLSYRNPLIFNSDNDCTFSGYWTGFSDIVKNNLPKKEKISFSSNIKIVDKFEVNGYKVNSYLKSLESDSLNHKSILLYLHRI